MREQSHSAWDSAVVIVVVAGMCAAIGLIALPLAFGAAPLRAITVAAWLVSAVCLSVVLLALVPKLSAALSEALRPGVAGYGEVTPSQTRLVSRLAIIGVVLVVTQAILRRPLAMVISGEPSPATVEAGIAALALAVVLGLLVWLYQTARPMLQALTLRAIDAAIPTVGEASVSEPTRTMSVTTAPTAMGLEERTLPSTGVDGPTLPSVRADQATLRVPTADPDITLRSDPDVTLRSDPDATLRADDSAR